MTEGVLAMARFTITSDASGLCPRFYVPRGRDIGRALLWHVARAKRDRSRYERRWLIYDELACGSAIGLDPEWLGRISAARMAKESQSDQQPAR